VGAVFRPEDLGRDYRKMIENAVKDFSPNTRDNVVQLLYSWEGKTSGKKLAQILGQDKAEKLLKRITEKEDVELSDEERTRLRGMFKESLTFD
jgi:hypothetical protein